MSGISQKYVWHMKSESFLVYVRVIFSESPWFMSGIYPTYDFECQSTCSSNAIGMQRRLHTYFGCQGCLLFSAKGGLQPPGAATPERPQMQPNVLRITGMTNWDGFNVVAAATTEKYHDDVHIELAQCLVRKWRAIQKQIRKSSRQRWDLQDHQIEIN